MVFFSRAEGLVLGVCSALLMLSCPALAQSGPTVHSPEAMIDCKGIENGANRKDSYGDCCLPGEMIYCGACKDHRSYCEKQTKVCGTTTTADRAGTCCNDHPSPCNDCGRPSSSINYCERQTGVCNTSATADSRGTCCSSHPSPCNDCSRPSPTQCETALGVCGAPAPDSEGKCCLDSQKQCGRCSGCRGCRLNSHCQNPAGDPKCNPGYSDPNASCPYSFTIPHGSTLSRIQHLDHVQGTGYLWSSNVGGELLSCFGHSVSTWRCNDGTMVPN